MSEYGSVLFAAVEEGGQRLSQIEPHEYAYKPTPDRWSKKEILGHLIDSAYNNHRRFLKALSQDNLIFDGYAQDNWVVFNRYQERDPTELIHHWSSSNRHLAKLIDSIDTTFVNRVSENHNYDKICMNTIASDAPSSLSYLIWDYIFHLEHHLVQLAPGYERKLKDFTEY